MRRQPVSLAIGQQGIAAFGLRKYQLRFHQLAGGQELDVLWHQARRLVELGKSFLQVLAVLQLQSARVCFAGVIQIFLRRHAVDAAGHAIAAGNERESPRRSR